MQLRVLTDQLIFIEERTRGHSGILGDATVVAFAAAPLAGEHSLGASIVLLKLQVLVDSEGVGHGLYVEVVGADECEGPALFLQLLNHRADHLQRPFLATVLLAVGDDGHQHMVTVLNLSIRLGDTLADGIVERCAATGAVGFPVQILGLRCGQVIVVPSSVAAVEGEQGDELLLIGEFLLHLADSLMPTKACLRITSMEPLSSTIIRLWTLLVLTSFVFIIVTF